jgi:acetyl-CoA carboxylase biotin carboxyl carrier protein
MDLVLIERLMKLLEASDLEVLDITEGDMRIRLAKSAGVVAPGAASEAGVSTGHEPPPIEPAGNRHTLAAGIAGTFYRSPSPGAAPFVKIGDSIAEGQQLGIVEAMKMLNPVEADCEGTIADILVADAGSVEPGTALFIIETR